MPTSIYPSSMLARRVGEYRTLLKLDEPAKRPGAQDHASFVFWILASVIIYLIAVAPLLMTSLLIDLWIFWR
jgi:hypothetical protein